MPISSGTRTRNLLATAMLLALSNAATATPTEPGVSHDWAVARAARLSNIRYRLSLTLKEHESAVAGTETLTFESRTAGDLSIDYRDGVIQSATFNDHPIPKELENGHLNLPAIVGQNTLTLAFISNAAPAGKAITHYEDKDDGNEYFYTLFVPMDASMAFPCFDQPDLKARLTLDLERPAGWSVIGNRPRSQSMTGTRNSPRSARSAPFSSRSQPDRFPLSAQRIQPNQPCTCASHNLPALSRKRLKYSKWPPAVSLTLATSSHNRFLQI